MKITNTISVSGLITNYELSLNSKETDGETTWFETKKYQTVDGRFLDEDFYEIRDTMDEFYYDYRKELNKIMKQAGGITFIGLSLIALITGLSLRLKKSGNDLVFEPSQRASKIKP